MERKRNVYVGNLNVKTTKLDLQNLFKPFGNVQSIYIANPGQEAKYTYGFVHIENKDHAALAIEKLNGIFFQGRRLKVERGSSDPEPSSTMSFSQETFVKKEEPTSRPEAKDRGKYLNQLKDIFLDVCQNPVSQVGAKLPNMSRWLAELDRLPLSVGPSFGQKKPKCLLDLDILDDLSHKYWK